MDVKGFERFIKELNNKINDRMDNRDFHFISITSQSKEKFIKLEKLIDEYVNHLSDKFFDSLESYVGTDWLNELPSLRPFLDKYDGIILSWDSYLDFDDSWREDNKIRDSFYFNKICDELLRYSLEDISEKFNYIKCANGDFIDIDGVFLINEKCWIERVRNSESFYNWIKELNSESNAISRDLGKIGTYDFKIPFIGTDEEMNNIPRTVDIKFIESTGYDWIDVYKKMQVNIKDGEISITYDKNKIGDDYFDEIMSSLRRIKLDLDGFHLIDSELLTKAQYLKEKKIKCKNPWYFEYIISDIIDDYDTIKKMAIDTDNYWTYGPFPDENVGYDPNGRCYSIVYNVGGVLIKLKKQE